MMLCMLAMRDKGLKSKELHENEEGTGEKPRCRKMHGQNVKGTGQRERKERNANKQFMGNGWMEWAGKRMDKKDAKLMEMKGR